MLNVYKNVSVTGLDLFLVTQLCQIMIIIFWAKVEVGRAQKDRSERSGGSEEAEKIENNEKFKRHIFKSSKVILPPKVIDNQTNVEGKCYLSRLGSLPLSILPLRTDSSIPMRQYGCIQGACSIPNTSAAPVVKVNFVF